MRIGIDATCWQNTRGFGRFTRELVRHLVQDHAGSHHVTLVVDRVTADQGGFPSGAAVLVAPTRRPPVAAAAPDDWRSPLDLWRLGRTAASCGADVFWFPAVSSFYPVPGRVPVAVTIHDAMTETRPELFFPTRRAHAFWRAKIWLARIQATTVITPSESARQAVAAAFGWPADRIARIDEAPAGVFRPHSDTTTQAVLARHGLPTDRPLVLYVGAINPHKNLDTLLRAMAHLRDGGSSAWHLALVGEYRRDGTLSSHRAIASLRDDLGLRDRITLTGFVPDEDLSILYNAAALLVLPSLDEGFGLPVVEAMACGLPVAVSARGSLPALAGDAGLTFDPRDSADMALAIGRLLGDERLRETLGARALGRAASFTWTESARQLLAVLEETAAR